MGNERSSEWDVEGVDYGPSAPALPEPVPAFEDWETVESRFRAQTVMTDESPEERNARSRREAVEQTVGGPADLLSGQSVWGETNISTSLQAAEANRGVPHPDRSQLVSQWKQSTRARLSYLTGRFGDDAMILGHLLFKIPPVAIRIKKGNITYRWKPLRTKESIAVKSGNGEAWIEIDLAFVGLQQINSDLGGLITLWKKAPICFVENKYIRENMVPEWEEDSMALCLESLVMDAVAGHPDLVWATAITRWFNYKPFSQTFFFRRDWREIQIPGAREPSVNVEGAPRVPLRPASEIVSPLEEEAPAQVPPVAQTRPGSATIVDLSQLESPGLESPSMPVEARLEYPTLTHDPGDPLVEPTSPVVYPFNSEPFMAYVTSGPDAGRRISEWNDRVTFNWKSFDRRQVPQFWQNNYQRPPQVVLPPPSSRNDAANDDAPVPVQESPGRDIILFLGDSIMHNFTATGYGTTTPVAEVELQQVRSDRFPSTSGKRYFCIARDGIGSSDLLSVFNRCKSDSRLKTSGGADLSAVAGVVIHCGINDSWNTGPNIAALRSIMQQVSTAGGIPVLLPLPPEGDSTDPALRSGLRGMSPGETGTDYWLAHVNTYHQSMVNLTHESNLNAWPLERIDYHQVAAQGTDRNNRAAPLKAEYMTRNSPRSGLYNIHPNGAGSGAIARFIHGHWPWGRAQSTTTASTSDMWRVLLVEDGDTVFVCNSTGMRTVRLANIDAPEVGHGIPTQYNMRPNSPYTNAQIAAWLPEAQDSWRRNGPRGEIHRWGEAARAALSRLIGMGGSAPMVRIEFNGMDVGGERWLGTLFKDGVNLNERLVEMGVAFAFTGGTNGTLGGPYEAAMVRAGGPGHHERDPSVGLWAEREVQLVGAPADLPNEIREMLTRRVWYPSQFRDSFPFGGFHETGRAAGPENLCAGSR